MSTEMSVLSSGKAENKYFPLYSPAKLSNCFILCLYDVFCTHILLIL